MSGDVKVTIICMTYNHSKYIETALEGFLMQKCDFKYEVLIHDDCSTDGTIEILQRYEKKYPEIIRVLYEEKNLYSQGKLAFPEYIKLINGKYVAFCEGDDYWIDPLKLQKQADYLDSHEDCSLTIHDAYILNDKTGEQRPFFPTSVFSKQFFNKENKYNVGEMELIGFIPTASIMTRNEYMEGLVPWKREAPAGDIAIKLYCASKGYTYLFSEKMSVYRVNTGISMTDRWRAGADGKGEERKQKYLKIVEDMDRETGYQYHEAFDMCIKWRKIHIYLAEKNYSKLKDRELRPIIRKLGLRMRLSIFMRIHFPVFFHFLYGKLFGTSC